jgi:hypothetical protein
MTDRLYALTKVRRGDYLLPANDGQSLWRIARDEGEGWSLWRWADAVTEPIDTDDWSRWECLEARLDSRGEGVREAMRLGL